MNTGESSAGDKVFGGNRPGRGEASGNASGNANESGNVDESGKAVQHDALALALVRSAAFFTRTAGRLPGVTYSSIAWRVLGDLEREGPARVSDLAQQQNVTQPSMTALVNRLTAEGWVAKSVDPEDGRASLVQVTAAGASALGDYRLACASRVSPMLAELNEADLAALTRAVEIMADASDIAGPPRVNLPGNMTTENDHVTT